LPRKQRFGTGDHSLVFLAADKDRAAVWVVGDPDRGYVIAVGVGDAIDVLVSDVDQQAGKQGLLEVFEGGVRRYFDKGMSAAEIELVGLIPGGLGPVEGKGSTDQDALVARSRCCNLSLDI
jgi:hypothetical protein